MITEDSEDVLSVFDALVKRSRQQTYNSENIESVVHSKDNVIFVENNICIDDFMAVLLEDSILLSSDVSYDNRSGSTSSNIDVGPADDDDCDNGFSNSNSIKYRDRLRATAWKKCLNVDTCSSEEGSDTYLSLSRKISSYEAKIKNDAFRTFKGNDVFWNKIKDEGPLIRVLTAVSNQYGYVQGMNVLLAPFLHIMSEVDSYYCFRSLVQHRIPRYVMKNLDGVHAGDKLFSRCLKLLDPVLYEYIIKKIPTTSIFSLPYILTLFANAKPLSEVLKLWDGLLSFGVHYNILYLCGHLIKLRDSIMVEKKAARILSIIHDEPVESKVLIHGAQLLMQSVPPSLIVELIKHPISD